MNNRFLSAGFVAAALVVWGVSLLPAAPAAAQTAQPAATADEEDEDWQGLPPGPGREEVFYLCQACHSLAIVKQQGLNRAAWEEVLEWMVEEQGMDPLDEADKTPVLDYLSTHFGR